LEVLLNAIHSSRCEVPVHDDLSFLFLEPMKISNVDVGPATSSNAIFKPFARIVTFVSLGFTSLGSAWSWMRLVHEPGAGSGEREKREQGAGIVVGNPKIDKFHQK
jgi:hypothetical protein